MNSFPISVTINQVFVQNENNNRWYIAVYESRQNTSLEWFKYFYHFSSVINLNQWHNVVYTASSSSGKKIYVDGTESFYLMQIQIIIQDQLQQIFL